MVVPAARSDRMSTPGAETSILLPQFEKAALVSSGPVAATVMTFA
jgi:hypothetical protein